jgi:hypothetical protein
MNGTESFCWDSQNDHFLKMHVKMLFIIISWTFFSDLKTLQNTLTQNVQFQT